MSRRNVYRFRLSDLQASALQALLQQDAVPLDDEGEPDAPLRSLIGICLPEDRLIDYAMQPHAEATASPEHFHVRRCPVCAAEVTRLRQCAGQWDNESAFQNLEDRIVQSQSAGFAAQSGAHRVSLRALMIPPAAFAQAQNEDGATVTFEVKEMDGRAVPLRGTLHRQNREFYLQIHALQPSDKSAFLDRIVLLTIVSGLQSKPLLQRRIEIGVTVLLGTDLRLTESSYLEATLLP